MRAEVTLPDALNAHVQKNLVIFLLKRQEMWEGIPGDLF